MRILHRLPQNSTVTQALPPFHRQRNWGSKRIFCLRPLSWKPRLVGSEHPCSSCQTLLQPTCMSYDTLRYLCPRESMRRTPEHSQRMGIDGHPSFGQLSPSQEDSVPESPEDWGYREDWKSQQADETPKADQERVSWKKEGVCGFILLKTQQYPKMKMKLKIS